MLLLNKLLGPYLTEPRLEKTRSFSLKKDKPKIKRQPSTNVSDQQRGDCWNYSCCRVIVRLIFNVLTIKEEDNEECDLWYININNLKIDEVKEKCIKNEDNSSYKKILLYLFLICVGYTKYLCNGTGDGQDPANVFKFFTKTILNNPNFKESKRVKEIQHNLFDLDFDTIIFPMITAFQEKTKLNCVTKQLKSFENLDEIRSVLDNGLYMVIGVSLGKSPAKNRKAFGEYEEGKYRKAFDEYEEGKKRPVASSIESKGGGHAMTIVKYNNIKNKKYIFFDEIDPDLIQLTIKNSWGNKWGINGTIDILSYELKTLCSVLDWVEPEDKTILSSIDQFEAIPRRKISDINELEIIDETDKIYIEKCYAFIKSLANDDGNINGQTLSKMYFVFFDVLPLTHERPDPMIKLVKYINNNDDINIDIDSFVERIYDTRCTYTYFDVRDDITPHKFKDLADKIKTTIHLPEKEKSDIAEKIRTVDLQKALDKNVVHSVSFKSPVKGEYLKAINANFTITDGVIKKETFGEDYTKIVLDPQYKNLLKIEIDELFDTINEEKGKDSLDPSELSTFMKKNPQELSVKLDKLKEGFDYIISKSTHEGGSRRRKKSVKKTRKRRR